MCKCIACTDPWCIGLHPPTWVGQHHEWRQGVSRRWISRDEFLPPNREELGPKALNGGCRMFGNASIVAQAWHFEAWRASCLVPLFFFASGLQNRTAIHLYVNPTGTHGNQGLRSCGKCCLGVHFVETCVVFLWPVFPSSDYSTGRCCKAVDKGALCNTARTVRILKQAGSRNLIGIQLTRNSTLLAFSEVTLLVSAVEDKERSSGVLWGCWCPKTQKKRLNFTSLALSLVLNSHTERLSGLL